jgi:hypothetical protein
MKVECPHCKTIIPVDDADVRSYINRIAGMSKSEAKIAACRANASKPRPGAQGKPKPRKTKEEQQNNENSLFHLE